MNLSEVDKFQWKYFTAWKVKRYLKMVDKDKREGVFARILEEERRQLQAGYLQDLEKGKNEAKNFFQHLIQEGKEFGKVARDELEGWRDAFLDQLLP